MKPRTRPLQGGRLSRFHIPETSLDLLPSNCGMLADYMAALLPFSGNVVR